MTLFSSKGTKGLQGIYIFFQMHPKYACNASSSCCVSTFPLTPSPNWLSLRTLGHTILSTTTGRLHRDTNALTVACTPLTQTPTHRDTVKESNNRCNLFCTALAHASRFTHPYVWLRETAKGSFLSLWSSFFYDCLNQYFYFMYAASE